MTFTRNNIMKLVSFQKLIRIWKITNEDYSMLFEKYDNIFLYADPPYSLDNRTQIIFMVSVGPCMRDLTMTFSQNVVTSLVWTV